MKAEWPQDPAALALIFSPHVHTSEGKPRPHDPQVLFISFTLSFSKQAAGATEGGGRGKNCPSCIRTTALGLGKGAGARGSRAARPARILSARLRVCGRGNPG